jgi:hypothetical protein
MMIYILPRLVSVVIDRRLEQMHRINVAPEALITMSARLPLPIGWRFWSLLYDPNTSQYIAIIEHDSFPHTIDGEAIPQWPVFDVRALAHLTLCGDTRLHA